MIRAYVNNEGKISDPDMLELKAEIAKHRNHEIEIPVKRRTRTSKQNNTLHWALTIFAKGLKEKGYKTEMEDLKYELQQRGYWGWVDYETKEGIKRRPKGSHEMTTDECANAFEMLQAAALQYDIIIPDPDPNK